MMRNVTTEKTIEIDDIGPVSFIRNGKSRNLKISVHREKGVRVFIPANVSLKTAGKFVATKKGWILKQQEKFDQLEKKKTVFNGQSVFRTRDRLLRLITHPKPTIRVAINQEYIQVSYPDFADVEDDRIQQVIRSAISEAWRIEAKKYLPAITDNLAGKYNFSYNKLSIRNNKMRWGSCSKDNNISLNLHLIRLPDHLCEYVILHELAHTVHKNHQKQFWALLDKITGDARKLDRELNRYRIEIW